MEIKQFDQSLLVHRSHSLQLGKLVYDHEIFERGYIFFYSIKLRPSAARDIAPTWPFVSWHMKRLCPAKPRTLSVLMHVYQHDLKTVYISIPSLGEPRSTRIMSTKSFIYTQDGHDSIKTITGKLFNLILLFISLSTTIGALWIVSRLGLLRNDGIFDISDNDGEPKLTLNRNLIGDQLIPSNGIDTRRIESPEILISTKSGPQKLLGSEIFMNSDKIVMSAHHYGSNSLKSEQLKFKLPKELDIIEIGGGMSDVKLIRSPSTNESSDLRLESNQRLELSGNMGVEFYSKELDIGSPEGITIESRENRIVINSQLGLYLTSVPQADDPELANQSNTHVTETLRFICIDRRDGYIRIGDSC